ncbi:MAG: hypothetical protein ACXWQO_11210 [Bdellovibrionota bacterium]
MQFIKTLALASVLLGATALPSFASEEFSLGGNDSVAVSSDSGMNTDSLRPRPIPFPRPHLVTCFARNLTGRMFSARDWNRGRAQSMALNTCRSRSFGLLRLSCRPAGCR